MSTKKSTARKQDLAGATISEFDGVRYLHLGTEWVQGAMRIRSPKKLELEYIQRMMAWMLWREAGSLAPDGGQALQLGLGAGAITRFTHQMLRWATTVVEINPTVLAANRLWFHLPPEDERLTIVEADAGQWVQREAAPASVDVLCVDLYDHEAAAPVLDDEAFYAACRALLADGGLMTVNLFGRDASFERSAAHIAAAFGADQLWQLAPTKEGNTIVVAGRGVVVPTRDELIRRADAIEAQFSLPARKWLKLVRPYRPGESAGYPA
jgi:spermidine synthase